MQESKIELEAAIPFKPEFMPLANTLYLILPYFLKSKEIDSDLSRAKKVFNELFEESLSQLPKSITKLESSKHLSSLSMSKQSLKHLPKFISHLKIDQFVKSFKAVEKKIFNSFFNVYTDEEFDLNLEYLLSKVTMLDNKALRLSIKSIDYKHADPIKSYKVHNSVLEKLNEKLFGSKNPPSNKEIEKLRIKDPEAVKELDKQRSIVKEKSWTIINDIWQNEIEEEFITSEEATDLCNKAGITLFPKEFKGFIKQSPVKGTELEFYSLNKERLDKPLSPNGFDLEMWDPKKHKSKGIFNCKFSLINEKGVTVPQYRYTLNIKANNAQDKFKDARELGIEDRFDKPGDILTNIRKNTFVTDLEFGNKRDKLCALLCIIGDMTSARLGTNTGENNKTETEGIHTCTGNSITIKESSLTISYIGKKNIVQTHVIPPNHETVYSKLKCSTGKTVVETVIEELLYLKNNRPKSALLFTLKYKDKAISENTVNDYLKEKGWPGTYHLFRTYFGCKMFYREMMKLKKNLSQEEIEAEFDRIVNSVAEHLGNTPGATIGSYIDKLLVAEFFKNYEIPSSILNTVEANQGKLVGVKEQSTVVTKKTAKEKVFKEKVVKEKKPIVKVGSIITILSDNKKSKGTIFKIVEKEDETIYLINLDNGDKKRLSSDSEYILGIE